MALTTKQLERRKKSLGGSDIATLLGHNPRSEYDLWMEKKHGVVSFSGNDATEFGNVVEGAIADWAADQLEVRIRKNVFRAEKKEPFHANLDAIVVGTDEAVEVKTTSYNIDEEWGRPGTDEVPHKVICQAQWQAGISDLSTVHIAAGLMPVFGGQKLRLYRVARHEELLQRLREIGRDWWNKYIIGDDVPTDLPSEAAIKAVSRIPNFERVIDRDLLAELIQAKDQAKIANANVKALTQQLHKALYDPKTEQWAEVGIAQYQAGVEDEEPPKVTYFQHYRKPEKEPRKGGYYRQLRLPKEI